MSNETENVTAKIFTAIRKLAPNKSRGMGQAHTYEKEILSAVLDVLAQDGYGPSIEAIRDAFGAVCDEAVKAIEESNAWEEEQDEVESILRDPAAHEPGQAMREPIGERCEPYAE